MAWIWWLAAALVLGIVEMMVVEFIFLMFAGGALAAMISALLGAPVEIQVIVFAIVSVVLLVVLRPYIKQWMHRTTPQTLTNAQALIGAEARTVHAVTGTGGRIKLRGEVWTARTANAEEEIPAGEDVVVVEIDGAIAVVQRPQATY